MGYRNDQVGPFGQDNGHGDLNRPIVLSGHEPARETCGIDGVAPFDENILL